jgi:biopolymer transport protein ExbB
VTAPAAPASAPQAVAEPAGAAAGASEGSLPAIEKSRLPQDLSPWGMFQSADRIVQGVMLGLLMASIVTWTIWLAKVLELAVAKRRIRSGLKRIADANSLADAQRALGDARTVVAAQLEGALAEYNQSVSLYLPSGVKERAISRLERFEAGAGRGISRGTGILATIGATAPFVGLFGTVWGIMNSFIGISKAQTTNLAVVAPGIAEALLATAFGLVAAIPAVIIYNYFTRSIGGYKALLADSSALIMRLLSRDLDRASAASHLPIARAAE